MLPIIIFTNRRIFRYYTGFSFFLFIWISRLEKDSARLIRHEKIHFKQQIEMLFVFHWLLYAFFYVVSRLKGHRHYIAYRYNPFELEAYHNDQDVAYLTNRTPYSWLRHIKEFQSTFKRNMSPRIPIKKEIGWD